MHNIVFLDRKTIPEFISIPTPEFEHHWQAFDKTSPNQVIERAKDATIIITNKVILNRELIEQLPHLQMIAIAATGTNNVDLAYCAEKGIAVSNIRGYADKTVPEHVVAMIFALRRNLLAYHNDIKNQQIWQQCEQFCFFTHPIKDVANSTLGIIGSGSLGSAIKVLATALGMKVLFAERKGATSCREGYLPFEQVLAESDILTLHCPLTESTTNLIDTAEFSQMKPEAILINTGRGGLVNETALVEALKSGIIAGAGVDVFTQEPAPNDNILVQNADLPNLILTPHVAWGSESAITTLVNQLISNITAFVEGKEQNRV
ncbi:D-2-hydroxyacid dehydrogenase [Vibrio sp. SS-MA-C1-2]|uniref:D-2-hydroxyacid dehydrogenase n=1 Tax=Vibrio sp. SS-MA-C1-2 TaxID=2908646 RepID=UPI001F427C9D|nr:D-2-hydroxyacid dehydrogenase [Vibrio sp. SS-MA-C1-2]UJF18572.1 D-2-hydroxyacid dehydrogenase [Vibrio sp. SS-MA-C1-2]